jgi:uncharacterized membrane protein YdjX (TVP38/TMEM64 family)
LDSAPQIPGGGAPRRRRHLTPVVKAGLLLAFLLACVVVVYLTPLKDLLRHADRVTAELQKAGFASRGLYVLLVAALVGIGCPRLLLCPIGGFAFGFWEGLLWSQIGTLIGSYVFFLAVRWGGHSYVVHRHPRLAATAARFATGGLPFVLMARLIPIAGGVVNLVLGLMPLKHRHFLIGTAIGTIPEAVPATLLGIGVKHGSLQHSVLYITVAVLILLALWLLLGWLWRSSRSKMATGIRETLSAEQEDEDALEQERKKDRH